MTAAPPITPAGAGAEHRLQPLLAEHHRELEHAWRALLGHAYGDDPRELTLQYRAFERSTLDHIAAEEELILPAYADYDADDARSIRDEHAAIQQLLFQIGVEVELHIVRAETVERLIATLRTHAAREDATMYPWAQDNLPISIRRRLFVRIGRSLRSLARRRSPAAA